MFGDKSIFRGGVHLNAPAKSPCTFKIEDFPPPERVYLPLSQHIGAPSKPIVKIGDLVKRGQVIAEADGKISAALHASVSGEVEDITPVLHPTGIFSEAIIIKNDGKDEPIENLRGHSEISELSAEYIADIVKSAGVVGMGGAAFPTHIKLSPPATKEIKYVIINGAECEPYLVSDYCVMLENAKQIIYGCRAIMKAVGAAQGFIAIEKDREDAARAFTEHLQEQDDVSLVKLETKYPQGSEKHLIKTVLGIDLPTGKLPMDIGILVNNVSTVYAIERAINQGEPLTSRIVTVAGSAMRSCRVFRVRIGTLAGEIIEACGGFKHDPEKVLLGGAMTGFAQYDLNVPITKGVGGILALTKKDVSVSARTSCIRCGRCIETCPMGLQPTKLYLASRRNDIDRCAKLHISNCIECGVCSYGCPAKQNIVSYIRASKARLFAQKG